MMRLVTRHSSAICDMDVATDGSPEGESAPRGCYARLPRRCRARVRTPECPDRRRTLAEPLMRDDCLGQSDR